MKKLILLSLILVSSICYAEIIPTPQLPIDSTTNLITYSGVVKVDSLLTKSMLFSKAREWFAKTYKSAKNVIQLEDSENGKIVGKALMQVYHKALGSNYDSGFINYTISIFVKDGRYKYEISNFYHTGQYVGNGKRIDDYGPCEGMINTKLKVMGISYQPTFNYYLLQLDNNIHSLIMSLNDAMISKQKESDNW